jgi:hypothetical protein
MDGAGEGVFNGDRGIVNPPSGQRAKQGGEVRQRNQFRPAGNQFTGGNLAEGAVFPLKSYPTPLFQIVLPLSAYPV